ncbi:MAG: Zn-dependent alcohol dehydrogenase [Actinomyces sp.]|nr:MAG: Zn-dependent alcohol dehydrogenase [Actinomyces sp.]
MRAAVAVAPGAPLEIVDDLELDDPRPGEVRVRIHHCGICHSDLTVMSAGHGLPAVLGHEAAGVVEAVGEGVHHLAAGDKVLLSALAPCGHCRACARGETSACGEALSFLTGARPDGSTPFSRRGEPVQRGLGIGGFAEATVIAASGAVRLDPDIPLEVACVIGCAVQTGVGAVFNTADVRRGDRVLVMGLGGIGQAVVQGARIAGATRIIASDPVEARREAAGRFGATDLIDPTVDDLAAVVAELTEGEGVDVAFEAAGRAELVETGIAVTRVGGTTVMVGASPVEESVTIAPAVLFTTMQKRLLGTLLGGCVPERDIPLMVELWQAGHLDLDAMVSAHVPLDDIEVGFERLRRAEGVRTVVDLV